MDRRKQLLALFTISILAASLLFLVFPPFSYAVPLFQDDFESGDTSAWTGIDEGGGGLVYPNITDPVHNGTYSMACNDTGAAGSANAYKDLSGGESEFNTRAYFYFPSAQDFPDSDGEYINVYIVLQLDPTVEIARAGIYHNNTNVYWYVLNDTVTDISNLVVTQDGWHNVELEINCSTGDVRLYVGEADIANVTILTGGHVDRIFVGMVTSGKAGGDTFEVIADSVVFDVEFIGGVAEENVVPTYSDVARNTTIAGDPCNFSISFADSDGILDNCTFEYDDGGGAFANTSGIGLAGASDTTFQERTLDIIIGKTIRYRWYVWDTEGGVNVTGIYSFDTTAWFTFSHSVNTVANISIGTVNVVSIENIETIMGIGISLDGGNGYGSTGFVLDTCNTTLYWTAAGDPGGFDDLISYGADKQEGNASIRIDVSMGGSTNSFLFTWFNNTLFDVIQYPVLRFEGKALNDSLPATTKLEFITGSEQEIYDWWTFDYDLTDVFTGSWQTIDIDLRFPDALGDADEEFPYLSQVNRFRFAKDWGVAVGDHTTWLVDNVSLVDGPVIDLYCYVTPVGYSAYEDETVDLEVNTRGGTYPWTYVWEVDEAPQGGETASTFDFSDGAGEYNVTCIVTDDDSTVTWRNITVTVRGPPPAQARLSPNHNETMVSDVRAVFIQGGWYVEHNWTEIIEVLDDYRINMVVINVLKDYIYDFDNNKTQTFTRLEDAIGNLTAADFPVHILFPVLNEMPVGDAAYDESYLVLTSDMVTYDQFGSPSKAAIHYMAKEIINDMVSNYSIDGIMFDYIRYDGLDKCYDNETIDEFEAFLGEVVDVPTDLLSDPEGQYYWNFTRWRSSQVTELLYELIDEALGVDPTLEIGAAFFSPFGNTPTYWIADLGQNVGEWVKDDKLDYISPFLGAITDAQAIDRLNSTFRWLLGKDVNTTEPIVPYIPWMGYINPERDLDEYLSTQSIADEWGIDGWFFHKYGGTGWELDGTDIRQYLLGLYDNNYLDHEPFAIGNITATAGAENSTITIDSTNTTTVWIEYNTTGSMFYFIEYNDTTYDPSFDREVTHYDTQYTAGIFIYNSTPAYYHEFSIPNGSYYRLIAEYDNVNVTTKVFLAPGIILINGGRMISQSTMYIDGEMSIFKKVKRIFRKVVRLITVWMC